MGYCSFFTLGDALFLQEILYMLQAILAGTVQMRVIISFHVKATGCFHMGDYFFISSQNLIHCLAVQFELESISCCGYCVNYNWEDMALKISVHILYRMEECHVLKTSLRNLGSRMTFQRKLMKRTKV